MDRGPVVGAGLVIGFVTGEPSAALSRRLRSSLERGVLNWVLWVLPADAFDRTRKAVGGL